MSTKVTMLTLVAALALTLGVGSVQGDDFTDQDISGNNYDGDDLSGSTFLRTIAQGTQFVGTTLTGSTFVDADIAGANFGASTLTVPQLITTGTWNQPTPTVPADYNYYQPGFDPRGLNAVLGDLAIAIPARSLNGVTLAPGMDLSTSIAPGTYLDFRGTDLNFANLVGVDLQYAVYNRETVLREVGNPIIGSTTVYVSGILGVMSGGFMVPVADASVLSIHKSLTLMGNQGMLVLGGGTIEVDPNDGIYTDTGAAVPNGIEIRVATESTIDVSRDVDVNPANPGTQFVVEMLNPIYGGGPTTPVLIPGGPPAPVPVTTVLNISTTPGSDWGVLSLQGDVTFEGLLSIDHDARVELIGDYNPGAVESGIAVKNGAVLMGTGTITMAGTWPGIPAEASEVQIGGGGTFAPGMIVQSDILGPQTAPDYAIGGKMIIDAPVNFLPGLGDNTFLVMIADRDNAGVDVSSGMTVNNNVVFGSGSSLELVFEDDSGYFSQDRSYQVLETAFAITGLPDLAAVNSAMLNFSLQVVPFSGMRVNLVVNPATAVAMNHNQRTIANAVDNVNVAALPAAEQADANALLGELQSLPASELSRQMQLLAGAEGPNNTMATLQTLRGVSDSTHAYLYQLRRAARKNNAAGTETVAVDQSADADAAAALQAMSYDWHMRADAIGIWGNVDRDGSAGAFGYSYDSYGFNLAIERAFAPNLIAGMTLAGFTTDLDGDNGSGDADSDTLYLDLHATYSMGDFYINAALGYAHSWIDTHRHVIGGRRPEGSTESNYYTAGLEFGYNLDFETVNVEPYLRLDYAHSRTDGYNDHNGGAANTKWSASSLDSFRTSLGTRVEVPFSLASMPARVRADLAWEHEFADSQADASGRFLAVPINVESADLGSEALRAGVELEVDITDDISLSGGYQFRGNHNWDQHMLNLTLKCAW